MKSQTGLRLQSHLSSARRLLLQILEQTSLWMCCHLVEVCMKENFALRSSFDFLCNSICTDASAASSVRLSLRYRSFTVLSEWHISILRSSHLLEFPFASFVSSLAVTIHFLKLVAEKALSGLIPDGTIERISRLSC